MQQDQQAQNTPEQHQEASLQNGESTTQLEQKLEAEQRKAEEYLDLSRRTQADFVNYKRRVAQEQIDARNTAKMEVLQQILPVLDDLGRALQAAPPELENQPWVQGILLVTRRLIATLEHLGVRQVGQPGEQFDPRWHEAVTMETKPNVSEGTILNVTRPGYAFGDRVLRPAQVVVAGAPSPTRAV